MGVNPEVSSQVDWREKQISGLEHEVGNLSCDWAEHPFRKWRKGLAAVIISAEIGSLEHELALARSAEPAAVTTKWTQ